MDGTQVNLAAAPSQWVGGREGVEQPLGYKMPRYVHQIELVGSLAAMGLWQGLSEDRG